MQPERRECPLCHFKRIPYARKVTQDNKHWVIFQCPMCKCRDIDEYQPKKLWNGREFEDEVLPNEDTQE